MNVYPLYHGDYFSPLSLTEVRNLQTGVNKLVGMVSINLLGHAKPAACIVRLRM